MCDECRCSPCDYRCPNAPEPKAVHVCADCNRKIYEGEEYILLDGKYYHFSCLEEKTTSEMLELFECTVKEA